MKDRLLSPSSAPSRRTLIAAGLGIALAGAGAARADAPLSPEDKVLVDKAAAYLQGLGEMKGRFEQIDYRGGVSQGDIFLKRPGRARFAYDPPYGLLVISDGSSVMVSDPRLKSVNRYLLALTPLSILLAKQVRLDRGVVVTRVDRFTDGFAITARDAHHRNQGEITLTFGDNPMALREWKMTVAQRRITDIRLTAFEPTSGLDSNLFSIPSPAGAR
jgi:outer membrane lipoprotein-sorting protein